jgi:hypothetical protein
MKRLFPRAVPQALTALLLLGSACNPSSNVQPGAPHLISLSLVDPSGNRVDVTADTLPCEPGATDGTDCDAAKPSCEMGANVVCQCVAKDMCDPTIDHDASVTTGTLNCTFPPLTKVVATFDRLLNTAPFEAITMAPVATLTSAPPPPMMVALTAAADYTSTGSTTGLVFPMFGIGGPTIALTGTPAVPTSSTATFELLKSTVQAKDGKTPFTGEMLLADGKIAFKTSGFAVASISTPAAPAPMDMSASAPMAMGCPDAGAPVDAGADADTDAGVSMDAAVASMDAASDAPAVAPTATPDVPSDMNKGAITITFTNTVGAIPPLAAGKTILDHITVTENDVLFTDIVLPDPMKDLPAASLTITPKTTWAPGKKYTVTVDGTAADVIGTTLGGHAVSASFTMSAN